MPPCPRRRYLRGCAATLGLAIAGCLDANEAAVTTPTGTQTDAIDRTRTIREGSPVIWQRSLGSPIAASPTGTGDGLYVGTESGTIESLAPADGSRRWSYDAKTGIRASPVLVDDTVFIVIGEPDLFANHVVVALDAETGTERWTFGPEEWWLEILGATEDALYVGTADDEIDKVGQTLYALSLTDGSIQWSGELGDPSGGLMADGTIYVSTYGRLYAYDTATGEQRWTRDVEDDPTRTIAATDETVCYVADEGDTRGKLFAVDSETGETLWSHGEWMATSTTLHGDTLYVGGEHIAAFDPASGEQRWMTDQSGYVPRVPVRDGVLYAGGDAIRAYDVGDGALHWTWTPETGVEGAVPAAIVRDSVYVDSWGRADPRNRSKFVLDTTTGERRWAFEDGTELTDLAVDRSRAYVGGENGVVYALR